MGHEGLSIVDVSVPTAPVEVAWLGTPGQALDVAVVANIAYVANYTGGTDFTGGLRLVDVSLPESPVEVGWLFDSARSIEVQGDLAFVSGQRDSGSPECFLVLDVSDPAAPHLVGETCEAVRAFDLAASGDHVFAAASVNGFFVVDVSTPAQPRVEAMVDILGSVDAVAVSEDHAYVGDQHGLWVFDVSTPVSPVVIGVWGAPVVDVAMSEDLAWVAAREYGLQVIDVSIPSDPSLAGWFESPAWFGRDVAVSGHHAFVATGLECGICLDYPEGLQVVDVSDPRRPVVVGSSDAPIHRVMIDGDYLIGLGSEGLKVLDVLDPASPVEVASLDLPFPPPGLTASDQPGVTLADDHVYIAFDTVLWVLDVSATSAPAEVGVLGLGSHPYNEQRWGVAVDGAYCYVACGPRLTVVDVSRPEAPRMVHSVEGLFSQAADIAAEDGTAVVATTVGEMVILDVSSPDSPTVVDRYPAATRGGSLTLYRGLALTWDHGSLAVIGAGPFAAGAAGADGLAVVDLRGCADDSWVFSWPDSESWSVR
jgi:hypothetical protein